MGLQIDWENELILITSPTTDVDAQTLHDFIEDQMATPVGSTHADIQQPEGKIEDPNNPGVYSQIIMELHTPWQIQFWPGSGYTRIYGGKIVGGLNNEPMKATGTAGDITVLESPVDGVTVVSAGGGTSFTEEEKAQIRDALGVDGDKTIATGGQLQDIPADVDSQLSGTHGAASWEGAIATEFHISIFEDTDTSILYASAWLDEGGQPAVDLDSMSANVLNLDGSVAVTIGAGSGGGVAEAGIFRWTKGISSLSAGAYVFRITATRGVDTMYGNRGFSKVG